MQVQLRFKPSDSPDVEKYAIYVGPGDLPELTKELSTVRVEVPKKDPEPDGKVSYILNNIGELNELDGFYDFGVATIDDAGNESPLLTSGFEDVTLDFIPPNPPTEGEIVYEP